MRGSRGQVFITTSLIMTSMPAQVAVNAIQKEYAVYARFKTLLSPLVQQAIEARVATWRATTAAIPLGQPAAVKSAVSGVLVMRPGTIPRPIDAFFFEVINRP